MPAYLVRLIKNRDLVGIFTADDFDNLLVVVDECTDVPGCEYMELPPGGIMWESPAKPIPLDPGTDEDDSVEQFPWATASLTERWWNFVYGFDDADWIPFVESDPMDPSPEPESGFKRMGPGQVIPLRRRRR